MSHQVADLVGTHDACPARETHGRNGSRTHFVVERGELGLQRVHVGSLRGMIARERATRAVLGRGEREGKHHVNDELVSSRGNACIHGVRPIETRQLQSRRKAPPAKKPRGRGSNQSYISSADEVPQPAKSRFSRARRREATCTGVLWPPDTERSLRRAP